jgi:hypothetical protein
LYLWMRDGFLFLPYASYLSSYGTPRGMSCIVRHIA